MQWNVFNMYVLYGMVWYGMVWHGMAWHGMYVCMYVCVTFGVTRFLLECLLCVLIRKQGGNPTLQLIAQRRGLQLWLISGKDAFQTYLLLLNC